MHLRDAVRLHSGDAVDIKLFEQAMRHLIDNYIKAEETQVICDHGDISLIGLVLSRGTTAADDLPPPLRRKRENVAEAIEKNVRRLIIDETPVNPKFYERMSELLSDLVKKCHDEAIDYAAYLEKIAELIRLAREGHGAEYPASIRSAGQKALFDNLDGNEDLALQVDAAICETAQDGWRGNKVKERLLERRLADIIEAPDARQRILDINRSDDEY